jgi:hypothetical protein
MCMVNKSTTWVCSDTIHITIDTRPTFHTEN